MTDSSSEAPRVSTSVATTATLTPWQRFKLVVKVIEVRLRFVAVLVITGLVIGYWDTVKNYWDKWTRPAASSTRKVAADTELYCPMHPSVVRPGLEPTGEIPKCPICGMPLSLRKKGEVAPLPPNVTGRVQISPERIQLAGIRTEEVGFRSLNKSITTVGEVTYDESRLSRIVTRASGYLEKLYVSQTFTTVKKGEPLAEIYSPDLYSAVRELLVSQHGPASKELVDGAKEKLRLFGIDDLEIDEIARSESPRATIIIRSPRHGHIIHRAVVLGAHVNAGDTLFEVAELSKVWIEAEIYEKDIPYLRNGQPIEATVEAYPERVFSGTVSLVHPHLQSETRTNQVRFVLENPDHVLRPGMFATVRVETPLSEIEPWKSLATITSRASSGPRSYLTCPSHADVLMDAPGKCPRCGSELERRDLEDGRHLTWFCPMHPEVTASSSGATCVKCSGMKLVPRISAQEGAILVVPERAVVDTGSKKIVYIEREPGLFEGVLVVLGQRVGEVYPVVKGLSAGDRVASTGAFLIDAETRLNPAAGGTYMGAASGPQGEKSRAMTAPMATNDTKQAPSKLDDLGGLSAADRDVARVQGRCPVSGQPLGSMGVPAKLMLDGQPVFLCCDGCEKDAKADIGKTLEKVAELKAARGSEKK